MDKSEVTREEQFALRVDATRRLMLKGLKHASEIAESLNKSGIDCTTRSVYRYMAQVKKADIAAVRDKEGLNQTVEQIAYGLLQTIEEVTRQLWTQYHAPTQIKVKCPHPGHDRGLQECFYSTTVPNPFGAMVKIAALREIRTAAKEWVEMQQNLGLVFRSPQGHQFFDADGNPTDPTFNFTKQEISNQFISFIKAKYQNPVGIKPIIDEKRIAALAGENKEGGESNG